MNLTIESLNLWGARALEFAWPVLWQSSLLIGLLFTLDFALRRRVRAAVRYALWLVVLLKLVLPPALALPTGLSWWLRPAKPAPVAQPAVAFTVTYGPAVAFAMPETAVPVTVAPVHPACSPAAWALMLSSGVSLGLLIWMLRRWRQVARDVQQAGAAPQPLKQLLEEARQGVGLRRTVRLGLTEQPTSPAVCGLFHPRILLPRALAEQLPSSQLRAILVHELIHLRRGDVWVNCAQALLQLLYWWHPLLWLANARIRQVREEAVDDAVMAALQEEAEAYAPTLLEVARLALQRPLTSLGLVGILESRSSLRQRIQRLLECHPPRKAGLTLASVLLVLAFAAVAVPMGEAPAPTQVQGVAADSTNRPVSGPVTNGVSVEQKHAAALLVHDGMLLYQMGKLDEASVKLKQANKLDPQNQAAYYYLNLVTEAKAHDALRGTPPARANGRQLLFKKLDTIRLDAAFLQASTLGEAVRLLAAQTREHDPDKTGINFIIAPSKASSAAGASATNSPGISAADLAAVRLTLKPSATPQKLVDILNEVLSSAERPLKYTVEDYAVIFSARQGPEAPRLSTRTFKVDPNLVIERIQTATGRHTNAEPSSAVSEMFRSFLEIKGVKIEPPKSVFFNGKEGKLYVRATLEDLDTIEEVLHTLNSVVRPQIHIASKFVEISQDDTKAQGVDWYLGNFLTNKGSIGTAPSYVGAPSAANPSGAFPGNAAAGTTIPPSSSDSSVTSGLRNPASSPFILTGILTDPQYRVFLHALDQRQAAEVLAAPQVVTISGRAAQCKAVQVMSIEKGVKAQALTSPGLPKGEENSLFEVEQLELGPVLDVAPTLLADGFTVRLQVTASVTEFGGYENTTNRVTVYVDGQPKQVRPPQPIVRQVKVSSDVNVWDGQTVVLGGLISERLLTQKDGRTGTAQKRNVFVLITPTLVDPAGNRLHSEEEMPFSQNSIPPQPKR
jgi:beta-lactamase regulating signal transducer with metallopeptidase domain/type II secretory pathway component GspD/PulD (secretin)